MSKAKRIWIWQSDNKFHCWLSRSHSLPHSVSVRSNMWPRTCRRMTAPKWNFFMQGSIQSVNSLCTSHRVNNWLGLKHILLFAVRVAIQCETSNWFVACLLPWYKVSSICYLCSVNQTWRKNGVCSDCAEMCRCLAYVSLCAGVPHGFQILITGSRWLGGTQLLIPLDPI